MNSVIKVIAFLGRSDKIDSLDNNDANASICMTVLFLGGMLIDDMIW